jgi:hypothetical protein
LNWIIVPPHLQLVQTPLLDVIHANRRSRRRSSIHLRITPKPTFADDRWQPIHMHNMVDLWKGWHKHGDIWHQDGKQVNK